MLFFENYGTRSAPAFREAPQKFPALKINGYVATPAFSDIDDDHDIDLFAGAYAGAIALFENQGTRKRRTSRSKLRRSKPFA